MHLSPAFASRVAAVRLLLGASTVCLAALAVTPAQAAAAYTFTILPTLGGDFERATSMAQNGWVAGASGNPSGFSNATVWQQKLAVDFGPDELRNSAANGLNETGDVVGYGEYNAQTTGIWWHGSADNYTVLPPLPTGRISYAADVNAGGEVVGRAEYTPGRSHATLWRNAAPLDLGTLGGEESEATAINDAGVVAGWAITADGYQHAARWINGVVTDMGTLPGGQFSEAYALNENGEMAGVSDLGAINVHATLWSGGSVIDLGTLGGSISQAKALNNLGTVVGWAYTASERYPHATIWTNGQIADLNQLVEPAVLALGWRLRQAMAVNDAGLIAGESYNVFTGLTKVFLLTPKP
ncbi:hypothetical protein LRH25_18295 [Ideonella azotifigens]|uniref:DUF3466 family protein n=1 Tax=Ideonella azotifigens TaxID=513160 RepID=A0ABN1K7E0_9BURK|nr:hypothetical protein [Ideonella azotifigens]MCD2342283.1 hypothetical protein [Ideonella azotifigens]